MSWFSSAQKVASIRVDKELLRRIEEYVETELVKLSGVPQESFPRLFSISITDSVGTEVLRSISEHRPAQLPDSIQRVVVSFDSSRYLDEKRALDIDFDISFSRDGLFSAFSVTCNADTARDTVVGIRDAILRLLEPHWTHNRFFHPGPGVGGVLWIAGWMSTSVAISLLATGAISAGSWLLLVAFCFGSYGFAGRVLKPWTTFDTRADRLHDEWWRWLKYGTVAFVLFGTIFTLARKRLLGF